MRRFHSGDCSGKDPEWYWKRGLHDAHILRTEALAFDYDYTQRNPARNGLKIHLNASDAMFDTTVTCITLLNYKVLLDESANGGYEAGCIAGCYWMQDTLKYENGKYVLELVLLGEDDFKYVIQFENAEIQRSPLSA